MALTYTTDGVNYNELRYDLIRTVEGFEPGVYFDNADNPQATIGVGFNLNEGTVRDFTYAESLEAGLGQTVDFRDILMGRDEVVSGYK